MKTKLITKYVILAVAILSIVGVGAVSFALWTGNTDALTAQAQIGSVKLYGWTDSNPSLTLEGSLVPADQTGDLNGGVKFISKALPQISANQDYTLTVSFAKKVGTFNGNSKLRVLIGDELITDANLAYVTTSGKEIAEGATAEFAFTVSGETYQTFTKYITIQLISGTATDMDATLELSVGFTTATPAA